MSTFTYCFSYTGPFYLFLNGYPQILISAWRFIQMPLLLGLMFQNKKTYEYSFSRDQLFSPLLGLHAANEWWGESVALPRITLRDHIYWFQSVILSTIHLLSLPSMAYHPFFSDSSYNSNINFSCPQTFTSSLSTCTQRLLHLILNCPCTRTCVVINECVNLPWLTHSQISQS